MPVFVEIIILVLSIYGLWQGAVWLVESAAAIAKRFGISEIIIGLSVVAFGTSAPEFAVTITAAIKNQADISVGNIIGSNIFNLGFILGGVAVVRSVSTSKMLVFRDGIILIVTSALLVVFLSDLYLSAFEGIILNIILIIYLVFLFYSKEPLGDDIVEKHYHWFEVPRLFFGLVLIIAGGYYLVESASELARFVGISEWVIGMTIVAAATSAPEFVTSLVAAVKGKYGISAGNLVGSNLFNILGVLGLASWIRPMAVESSAYTSMLLLTILTLIVVVFMRSSWRVSRLEGVLLIVLDLIVYLISIF